MSEQRDPFECWYSLADAADRLGVTTRTVRRALLADSDLRLAAREFFGELRIPWSAWEAWLSKRARWIDFSQRAVVARKLAGRFVRKPVRGRNEAEGRRKLMQDEAVSVGEVLKDLGFTPKDGHNAG